MTFGKLNKDESLGLVVSAALHIAVLMLAFLIKLESVPEPAFAFIEVSFGEFQQGRPTAMASERNDAVATAKNPSAAETTPDPEQQKNETAAQTETAKSAELAKQTQDIKDETVISTPKSENLNPQKTTEEAKKEVKASAKDVKKADEDKEGAESSGDVKGKTGSTSAQQGSGEDEALSAPYQLTWEGDVVRKPLSELKPAYNGEVEAIIKVRFQVRPDGTVGQMMPLIKMNPELEREVFRTLRTARFSKLPAGAPQQPQWGIVTFRFVLE